MKKFLYVIIVCILMTGISYYFVNNTETFNGVPETVDVYDEDAFFYSSLGENTKKAYNLIMREIYDFPEKIIVPDLTDKELSDLFEAVLYDNNDLFFLKPTCSISSIGPKTYFKPEYLLSKEEYAKRMIEVEKAKENIVSKITTDDEYEIELFIHEEILKNCKYEENDNPDSSSIYGCLVLGKASCEGYSRAIKSLLDEYDIENFFALGQTIESPNPDIGHMWNIVRINGNFYHLDSTWNDHEENDYLSYSYFNISDNDIGRTHIVENRFLGFCNSLNENYFVKNNLYFEVYDEYAKNVISEKLAQYSKLNRTKLSFRFENELVYNIAKKDLFDNEEIYRLLQRANLMTDKKIQFNEVNYFIDNSQFTVSIVDYY